MLLLQAAQAPFAAAGEIAALASAGCWGVATVLFRERLFRHPALATALWKNLLAAVLLGLLCAALAALGRRGAPPSGRDLGLLLGSGALGIGLGDWLYFAALAHLGVTRTLILIQMTPILTAAGAWAVFGEVLGPLQWAGAAAVVGGGILAESAPRPRRRGDAAGVLAAVFTALLWSTGNLLSRAGLGRVEPLEASVWRLLGSAAVLVAILLLHRGAAGLRAFAADRRAQRELTPPALIGTVLGIVLLNAGLKWAPTGAATSLSAATPLFSIPLAVLLLGERHPLRAWAGAALVAAGVVLFLGAAGL